MSHGVEDTAWILRGRGCGRLAVVDRPLAREPPYAVGAVLKIKKKKKKKKKGGVYSIVIA